MAKQSKAGAKLALGIKEQKSALIYLGLSLLIVAPLFGQQGYLFLLDWTVKANISLTQALIDFFEAGKFVFLGMDLLAVLFGFSWMQKIILLLVFWGLGLGGYRLARLGLRLTAPDWIAYFGGLLMIFNPFIYDRVMEGQTGAVLAVIFLVWFLGFFLRWWQKGQRKDLLIAALLSALSINSSPHFFWLLGLIWLLGLGLWSGREVAGAGRQVRLGQQIKKMMRLAAAIVFITLAVNGWMMLANGRGGTWELVEAFDYADYATYQTLNLPDGGAPWQSLLLLQGYWGEVSGRFIPVWEASVWWYLGGGLVILLAMLGLLKERDRYLKGLFVIGILISVFLGTGIAAGGVWKQAVLEIYEQVAAYKVMREPQKWAALLLVFYVYLGTKGIQVWYLFWQKLGKKIKSRPGRELIWFANLLATGLFVMMPVAGNPLLLGGASGQLQLNNYPSQWQQAAELITEKRVLILPWEQYISPRFVDGRKVINPAAEYFSAVAAKTWVCRGEGESVETKAQFLALKQNNKLDYIVLLKEDNWRDYRWLKTMPGLEIERESDQLIIFSVK